MMRGILSATTVVLGLAAGQANAVDIDWEFSGLFSANTFVSGRFTYDMSSNALTDIDLTVVPGNFTLNSNEAGTLNFPSFTRSVTDFTDEPVLFFLGIDMSDASTLNPFISGMNVKYGPCLEENCEFITETESLVEGSLVGTLPAIPLPAGLPLLAGGLAAFGAVRHLSRKS